MGKLAIGLAVAAMLAPALASADELPVPDGDYVAIAIRSATTVAAPLSATTVEEAGYLGRRAKFGDGVHWLDRSECESVSYNAADFVPLDLEDPVLSDLAIPANDGVSVGDRSLVQPLEVRCGDDLLVHLVMIDRRVLVVPSANGALHIILEKPLSRLQVAKLQRQLKDMKFYDGEITGEMNPEVRRQLGGYAEYRGAAYRFVNVAITENLLDGLGVLE